MMSDYDRTLELQSAAYESAGQSTIQFNKYQDTVEYKINQIKNSWEKLRVSLADQDIFKKGLDAGNQILSSIKDDFGVEDLAFIGTIGLTIGKTFITQMIKGIQTDSVKMTSSLQSQITKNLISSKNWTIQKLKLPLQLDTSVMEQDISKTTENIKTQLSKLSTDIKTELLTINNQPINIQGLASFSNMLNNLEEGATLSNTQIEQLYREMGQTGQITAGTQAFNNFKTQLELIKTELLETSGNENLTRQQAEALRQSLQSLTGQTQQLTAIQDRNAASTSRWGTTFATATEVIGPIIGNSLGTGITTGLSTYIMTGDFKQSFTIAWQTALTGAFAQIIPKIITAIAPLLTPQVFLIGIGITIATAVGIGIKKHYDKIREPIIESLEETEKEAKDRLERIAENIEVVTSNSKTDKENVKTITELKQTYDELSQKISLTSEEQEKWNETINTINDQYGDTVLYYDEMNNKLVLSENLWAKMEEEAKNIADTSTQIAVVTSINKEQAQYDYTVASANKNIESLKNNTGLQTLKNGEINLTESLEQLVKTYYKDEKHSLYKNAISTDNPNSFSNIFKGIYDELIQNDKIEPFDTTTFFSYVEQAMQNGENFEDILNGFYNKTEQQLEDYKDFSQKNIQDEIEAEGEIINEAKEVYEQGITDSIIQNLDTGSEITNRVVASQIEKIPDSLETFFTTLGLSDDSKNKEYAAAGFKALNINESNKKALLGYDYEKLSADDIINNINNELGQIESAEDFNTLFGDYAQSIADALGVDLENFSNENLKIDESNIENLGNLGDKLYQFNEATKLGAQVTDELNQSLADLYNSDSSLSEKLQNANTLGEENPDFAYGISSEQQNILDTYTQDYLKFNDNGQVIGGMWQSYIDTIPNFVDQYNTALGKAIETNGQSLSDFAQQYGLLDLTQLPQNVIDSIQSFVADNFTGEEAQVKAQQGFQELLQKMTSGDVDLTSNELSVLLNSGVDFSTNNPLSNDTLMKQAAEALQNASDGALDYDSALKKVESVYGDLINLVGEFQYGSEGAFNTLLSGSQMAADELSKQSEVILDIIDNYDSATGLSREQVNQLAEVGLDDLYELENETGKLQLNMSKVTDLFAGNSEKTKKAFEDELKAEEKRVNITAKYLKMAKETGLSQEKITEAEKKYNNALTSYYEHQQQASQELALRYQQNISLLQQLIDKTQELQDAADEAAEKVKDAQDAYNDAIKAEKDAYDNIAKVAQDADKAIQDAKDSAADAYDSWQDAIDAIGDAQEALAEANQELYEAIHGTDDYTTGLDRMYNASRRIDTIEKRMENLKETMENATNSNEIVKATEDYINMAKEKVNVLTAMNQVDQQTLNNMINDFMNNSSYDALKQFFRQTENGIEIDIQGIENADANDEIKNAAIEWAEQYNEIFDNILDRNDEISQAQKIMEDYYKTALDGYVNLQEKVADILKENAEEEISITEEKYESMKEADDAYLDALESAIDKQRQLREQANKYEDLAAQEKKLSLLSRDTSGANQKQVLELQQDVETSRTEILDTEIDNFLESMRELYETQQEARNTEIEYLNALMESTDWWTKTNEILNSFGNADDYKAWLMENDSSFGDMSVEQQEQYLMTAETDYNAIPQFDAAKMMMEQWGSDLSAMIQADVNEVNRIVNELGIDTAIGNQILTAGEIARDEMIRTAEEAVAEKEQAVADAQQSALDMEQAYYEALDAIKEAEEQKIEDVNNAQEEYLQACEDRAEKQKELNDAVTAQAVANEELQRAQDQLTNQQALVNELKSQAASIQAMQTTAEAALAIIQDIENREVNAQKAVFEIVDGNGNGLQGGITYGAESIEEVIQMANDMGAAVKDVTTGNVYQIPSLLAYAQGGMVDYTGPAWVDGTKDKPEAFLDPEDTQNIAELTAILSQSKSSASVPFTNEILSAAPSFGNILYPNLTSFPTSNNISNVTTNNNSSANSTNVEVHINVDSISSDYDVEQMLNVVEKRIYEVANPIGSSIILQK